MRTTDMADELFSAAAQPLPAGVRLATARHGGVTVTRVEIAREGLSRPRGRYVTLEMPSVSVLDERDAAVIEVCARELRALLPPEGPVLVLGVGNRRITADALGPRTVQRILVTMGAGTAPPVRGLRPVAAVAPGVAAATGLSLQQLAAALVGQLPAWRQNLRFAAAWERSMEAKYPGLTRPVLFSYRFYNQDLTTGSLLIEIGGHGNNLNEALYAGYLAAQGLVETLLG